MLTCNDVRSLFESGGISVAQWARENGFQSALVYRVLNGDAKCRRGETHRIAIALGIKAAASQEQQKLLEKLKSTYDCIR